MDVTFDRIGISGVLGVVPANVSRFEDEIANYSHSPASALKLKKLMGYGEHRLAPPGVCTSDLVEFGFRHLVSEGKLDPETIDALVLVTQTPDYILPSTSAILHGRLGLRESAYCVDINQGCNGYICGLFEAMMLIRCGAARRVLLAVGDTLSHRVSPRDRNFYPLVGDAAALTLVEADQGAGTTHLSIHNRGAQWETLKIPAGHSRLPSSEETRRPFQDAEGNVRNLEQMVMQGTEVFNFTQSVIPPFLKCLLERAGSRVEEIDFFMLHQANAFILTKIGQQLGIAPEKLPRDIVEKYGNSSSATIPVAMTEHLPRSSRGRKKLCLCGFGVGLSWGGAVLETDLPQFCELIEMESEDGLVSQAN